MYKLQQPGDENGHPPAYKMWKPQLHCLMYGLPGAQNRCPAALKGSKALSPNHNHSRYILIVVCGSLI